MMKLKAVVGLALCALYFPAAHAGSFTVANTDITLAGGATAGVVYSDHTGGANGTDTSVQDFIVELSSSADKGLGFTAGVGRLGRTTDQFYHLLDNVPGAKPSTTSATQGVGFQYGWVTVKPNSSITIDVGRLATKIGYEAATTYANPHILLGGLWTAQPVYYSGVRANVEVAKGSSIFVEANEDNATSGASSGWVLGGNTTIGSANVSAAYYDANKTRDIFDVIVSGEIGGVAVAANFDYHKLGRQSAVAGNDDSAVGLGLYVAPKFGVVGLPIRFEYFNDGTSNIYTGGLGAVGMKKGYSFTITPTYNFTPTTFVRAELATIKSDNKIFTDKNGVAQDSKMSAAVQAGMRF